MTNSAKCSIAFQARSRAGLSRTGATAMNAGRNNTEYTHAAVTPMATILPRSRNGGTSLKFSDRKPITVVKLVRNTGCQLMRRLSTIAACLSRPWRMV